MKKELEIINDGIPANISDAESRLMQLVNGAEPITPSEIAMVNEINKAKAAGRIIDIPGM